MESYNLKSFSVVILKCSGQHIRCMIVHDVIK